jgi:hypothetical protein
MERRKDMPKKNARRKQTITQSEAGDTTIRRYIENQDPVQKYIEEEFAEAQTVSKQEPGEDLKRERQQKKHVNLSAGDLDASPDTGSSGEETVGGSHPTPDQDNIDELGEAAGLTFQDSEQIRGEKIFERDTDRWELNPASSEDYEERNRSR